MRILTAIALVFTLSSCALLTQPNCAPTKLWTKPATTDATDAANEKEFFYDKFICIQQSQFNDEKSPIGLNWTSFNECMKAFGFTPAK